ncbi:GTPase IMAP family member 8-like [Antennarius striatus]|uniref:GTPase IMAP family member 8-like n=1 Tax=Antennarius striatus TaxID=241820 RepID=UPI0035AFB1B2
MSHKSLTNMKQLMVVLSTPDQWISLKSLLQIGSKDNHLKITFSSLGSHQVCDLTVDGRLISLHYPDLQEDMTEESINQAIDGCCKSCINGTCTFLLLIQGGHYIKTERRIIEILQVYFGIEALKFLIVLSLEVGKVSDILDDALLELINMCEGRYCQITSPTARDELCALLKMVDYMLNKNNTSGYTAAMLTEAKKRNAANTSMRILRQKSHEAEEEEQAFKQMVKQREEDREKEMEMLKAKHAEERQKEATGKKQHEMRREGLEEAVRSHGTVVRRQMSATEEDDAKKISVILLGFSGSGKSSAFNVILERAGNRYSVNKSSPKRPQPTLFCERKKVFADGQQLILVDTPELWDEDGVENLDVVKDCLALSLPGPHVFLLVLQVGRFTQGECEMLGQLQRIFGRDMAEHAIVLFVRFDGSQERPQSISEHVAGAHASLQSLVQKCGSRYYDLNITKTHEALSYPQVKDLLSGIYKLVASYGVRPHSMKRFSVKELREWKKVIAGRKEGSLEVNTLLRDA